LILLLELLRFEDERMLNKLALCTKATERIMSIYGVEHLPSVKPSL
jgi:hypothetical protein